MDSAEQLANRYQNQSWYVKLFRIIRHQWDLPYQGLMIWSIERKRPLIDDDDFRMTLSQCFGLAKGLSQKDMKYWYTWEEVKDRVQKKLR